MEGLHAALHPKSFSLWESEGVSGPEWLDLLRYNPIGAGGGLCPAKSGAGEEEEISSQLPRLLLFLLWIQMLQTFAVAGCQWEAAQ